MKAGVEKLSCRPRPRAGSRAVSLLGQQSRKAPKSSAMNCLVGANCQRIGPSLTPSSVTPLSKNLAIEGPASARFVRLVTQRDPLTEKTKSSGSLGRPFSEARRCLCPIEGSVDLDRRHAAAGIAELVRVLEAGRIKTPRQVRSPTADADADHARYSTPSRSLAERLVDATVRLSSVPLRD